MAANEEDQARVGQTVGKYRLERLIGAGGMATVYSAVHRNANRVAIKMLHPELSRNVELRARFLREGYVANTVGHRGAVRVLDDDVAPDGSVFLVMELLEGETVDARFEKQKIMHPREALEIGHRLLDVLAAAHDKGIVHRDIKPENLFLTNDGDFKVLDFGIARLREAGDEQKMTQTGRMIGTPAFMPPEQALGKSADIDARTDVWAVGATLFMLMSGEYVHAAETAAEMLIFTGSRPVRPLSSIAPQVPPPIQHVIDRALQFVRTDRWQSAREMAAAIEDAYVKSFGLQIPNARGGLATATAYEATAVPGKIAPVVIPQAPLAPTTNEKTPELARVSELPVLPSTQLMPQAQASYAQPVQPGTAIMPQQHIDVAPATARIPMSTTAGVARGYGPITGTQIDPVVLPRNNSMLFVGIGGGVVAIGAVIVVLSITLGGKPTVAKDPPPQISASVATSASAAPSAITSSATSSFAETPSAIATNAAPSHTTPTATATATPTVARPITPPTTAPQTTAAHPLPTAATAAPPPTRTATSIKNCDPPFTIDGAGHRVPKPECL